MYINWIIMYVSFNYERALYTFINYHFWLVNSMKKRYHHTN